jgi:hypothetical protein
MNDYEKLSLIRRRCDTMLLSMLGAEQAPTWWKRVNKAFDGRTGEEQWQIDPYSVYSYLIGHLDGYW